MKKYKIFLNIMSIILLIAAIGIIGYMAYDYISNYILTKEAEEAVNLFESEVSENKEENEQQNAIIVDINTAENTEVVNNNQSTNNTTAVKTTTQYKGYNIVGSIQIPKTKIKYPVVDTITPNAIAVAVTAIYGPGLNEVRKYSFSSSQL